MYVERFDKMQKKFGSSEEVINHLDKEIDRKYADIYFKQGATGIRQNLLNNLTEKKKIF